MCKRDKPIPKEPVEPASDELRRMLLRCEADGTKPEAVPCAAVLEWLICEYSLKMSFNEDGTRCPLRAEDLVESIWCHELGAPAYDRNTKDVSCSKKQKNYNDSQNFT